MLLTFCVFYFTLRIFNFTLRRKAVRFDVDVRPSYPPAPVLQATGFDAILRSKAC